MSNKIRIGIRYSSPREKSETCVICFSPAVKELLFTYEESKNLRAATGLNIRYGYWLCRECIDDTNHAEKAEAAIVARFTEKGDF